MPSAALSREFYPATEAPIDHALAEFAQGVQFMSETGKEEHVGELVEALTRQLQQQVRTKPHPLIYANLAAIVTLVFGAGVLYQRVNAIEERMRVLASADTITTQLNGVAEQQGQMRKEIDRLRDRLDQFLDKTRGR